MGVVPIEAMNLRQTSGAPRETKKRLPGQVATMQHAVAGAWRGSGGGWI